MTTTPAPINPAAVPSVVVADALLTERAQSSAEFLAGIIAAGMLDTLARPAQLPMDLFPDVPAQIVTAIWNRALTVGYRAGHVVAKPRWTPDGLRRLQAALDAAGYEQMGRLADRSANTLRAGVHPADGETDGVRGDHW